MAIKRKCFLQWHLVFFFFFPCAAKSRCGVAFPLLLDSCTGEKQRVYSHHILSARMALLFNLPGWRRASSFLTGAGSDRLSWVGKGNGFTHQRGHSLSLVGRGFFSFVSVFFSFVLSKRLISVMSGLSDILAVRNKGRKNIRK